MSNVILSLGGVPFQDMEVPEKISFGGKQRVVTQNLIGGGRVVSALGLDDGDISFSGVFSGGDAVRRAQILDAARALGAALPLVWDGFFYSVIIAGFKAEYQKSNLIPFTITCVVVSDPLAAVASQAAAFANLIGDDLVVAAALSGQAGISIAGLTATSVAGFSGIQGLLGSAIIRGGTLISTTMTAVTSAPDASTGAAAIMELGSASSQLAGLTAMRGYVNRAAQNIENEFT